jgi:hypothetical protein
MIFMGHVLLLFLIFLLFIASGIFAIIVLIDLCEYLKKYHSPLWTQISFERPFGISQQNFFFYPIRPIRLLVFLFSSADSGDGNLKQRKQRLKLLIFSMLSLLVVYTLVALFL